MNMARQGIKYHIHKLESKNFVGKTGLKGELNYIYFAFQ